MDAFYVSVEIRDNPELANKPVAVGGSRSSRGVLSTSNYIARQYGVRSAMPTSVALRKCPDLILVPGRMEVYRSVSSQIREIFERYTDIIEPLSLDEAYLDVIVTEETVSKQVTSRSSLEKLIKKYPTGHLPKKTFGKVVGNNPKSEGGNLR